MFKIKAIILAAGYATRLYPLTENTPKPLLEVAGKPIIEHIIDKMHKADVNDIYVVTNNKFFTHFLDWQATKEWPVKLTIVNDKTTSNDDRLGSLGDIMYTLDSMNIDDDIMIIAGDNLFEFSLLPVKELFKIKNKPVVALYDVKDIELAKLYGIVSINEEGKMLHFEEKPSHPRSTLSSTGVYLYPQATIAQLKEFLDTIGKPDKAGDFLEWLYTREEVYGLKTREKWFDIGSLEQLEKAREDFVP